MKLVNTQTGSESLGHDVSLDVLSAKFILVYESNGKAVNRRQSRWEMFSDGMRILTVTGLQAYEDALDGSWSLFSSEQYGQEIIKYLRKNGLDATTYMLTGAQAQRGQWSKDENVYWYDNPGRAMLNESRCVSCRSQSWAPQPETEVQVILFSVCRRCGEKMKRTGSRLNPDIADRIRVKGNGYML